MPKKKRRRSGFNLHGKGQVGDTPRDVESNQTVLPAPSVVCSGVSDKNKWQKADGMITVMENENWRTTRSQQPLTWRPRIAEFQPFLTIGGGKWILFIGCLHLLFLFINAHCEKSASLCSEDWCVYSHLVVIHWGCEEQNGKYAREKYLERQSGITGRSKTLLFSKRE